MAVRKYVSLAIYIVIVWAIIVEPNSGPMVALRRAVEPTVCTVFPVNLFVLPFVYPLSVFLYVLWCSPRGTHAGKMLRVSIGQTFRNIFIWHPSHSFAASALMVFVILELNCVYRVGSG